MCLRHQARLVFVAFGCLLDLSGKMYPRLAKPVLADARRCPRCAPKNR